MPQKFPGFTWPEGSYFPPELRQLLPSIKRLADLKVLLCILDSSFQSGLDSRPLTFDEIQVLTGLARGSVNTGLKKLREAGYIKRLAAGDTYAYEPSLRIELPCHDSLHMDSDEDTTSLKDEHAWESNSLRREVFNALVSEFGIASRVAQDIAANREPEYVMRHINYTRYELEAGFQPRNIAGFVVARIRDDKPMPLGYEEGGKQKKRGERWFTDEEYEMYFYHGEGEA